eukprot:CAMPEP_0185567254 /NCGR_PEP_ID=MMETSP0434-20130131/592_1 /TAXON_ID=626734 ORGANISM="Favella taraikaensis, Strain Fe Narragansett Bay" /NCGR_SAMPLE_ID=MMETSP0434 /ASSEMBLY_ACC=CAM_ASM_000379 /LENGTH=250 /DNA_ID=CAMNT_0028181453 /DNA_START=139 /DNA_END=893 /DNA_ORIENTATION=+
MMGYWRGPERSSFAVAPEAAAARGSSSAAAAANRSSSAAAAQTRALRGQRGLPLHLVVLGHRGLRVRLLPVRVCTIGKHQTLSRDLSLRAILEKLGLGLPCSDHEVFLGTLGLLEVLLDGLAGHLLLHVSDLAQVCAPGGQAEADDKVEEDDVRDEPPVKGRLLSAASVINTAPELHLDEEHAPANEKVEAKEQFGDLFEAVGEFDELEEEQDEHGRPEEEHQARRRLQVGFIAIIFDDDEHDDADEGEE